MQRWSMPFRAALLGLAGAVLAFAQVESPGGLLPTSPANPNSKRYAISGTVLNTVTNEPVRRALVHFNGVEQHTAFTGNDGRFQLENIPEGTIWVSAQRPGFFPPPGVQSNFRVGPGSNDFRVFLTPEAKLTGNVVDSEGEPIENVQIQALGEQIVEGHKQWTMRGAANTDENGVYKLEGQMPGTLVICTAARPLLLGQNSTESYPARCYPNSPDAASAQKVEIVAGQAARADFTLDPVRSYHVSGTVLGGLGRVGGWVEGLQPGQPIFGIGVDARKGRFSLTIPNGSWKLHFQATDGQGRNLEAINELNVNGADVTGVQVVLEPGLKIPIEFVRPAERAESTAPTSSPVPVLRLRKPGDAGNFAYTSSFVPNAGDSADASIRQAIPDVLPGTYEVSVLPSAACVGAVSSGGIDLLRQPLTVAPGSGPEPIVVTMRNDCASLGIALQTEHLENETTLLLVPESGGIEPQKISIAGSRSYEFARLSPGTYHVYAVSDAADLEYANPEAMRNIAGETVTLDANQKANVSLPVVERHR
jgi:hypothetical protein